uniref:dynein assembly factor 5, axonemal n=1 Tax=Ciona intestinalis TaxID=7719 RepID=UPI000180C513|nr:dynein assembly factor 5, axonemal [Ciona intestinalis]|eukprot:XP_002127221.1 dynein assembly factor 5, axonemal [Ciona intestinalis]
MSGDSAEQNGFETKDSVCKLLQRHVNCLSDESKITRKRGLIDLRKETIDRHLGGMLLQEISIEVLKPTLKCLADSSEKNRELAANLISKYISILPSPEDTLAYVIPTLAQRLGQQEITEPSEELRLLVLQEILFPCVELSGKKIAGYLDEMIQILQQLIVDPYAEVRKTSCKLAGCLARSIPEYFHMQSESLIKPLMLSITHQHSKVRIAVIEATADVIQFGNGKNVDDVISHLAQRFFDQSAQVRMTVTRMIGRWLLELPDRYSFFYKFIPLILTSFSDEMPDIRIEARRLWHEAGMLYQEENEGDLKDKLDFAQPAPSLYPKGVDRPCLGCRELVHRNLSKLTTAIIRDLSDWVQDTRVKTSQLLYELLLHAEDYITQHMQPLMQALLKACADDQSVVVQSALKCCNLIGAFVNPEIFCKFLIQAVRMHQISPQPIMIIAAVIEGCSDEVLGEKLLEILSLLVDPEVCQASEKSEYHLALISCVNGITNVCQDRVSDISLQLFTLVITVIALSNSEDVLKQCDESLLNISESLGISVQDLYVRHTREVLDSMRSSYKEWTMYSVEQRIFDSLISRAGPVVGEVLEQVMPMLEVNLNPQKDPELRLKFFTLLSKLLMDTRQTLDSKKEFSSDHAETIITKMIAPNLIWKAGRTSAAVRTIAVATLWALLRSGLVLRDVGCKLFEALLPQLKSALDDDVKSTRLTTAKVLARFLHICGDSAEVDKILHNIYMELLKRLDDASDEIRIAVTKTWKQYFKCFNAATYDQSLYRAHLEAMYGGLLVHMDDPDTNIQVSVRDVLKEGGVLSPKTLLLEITKVRNKHRTSAYCDQLIKHFEN